MDEPNAVVRTEMKVSLSKKINNNKIVRKIEMYKDLSYFPEQLFEYKQVSSLILVYGQQRALFHENQMAHDDDRDALAVMSRVLNQFREIVNKDAVLVYIESGPVIL